MNIIGRRIAESKLAIEEVSKHDGTLAAEVLTWCFSITAAQALNEELAQHGRSSLSTSNDGTQKQGTSMLCSRTVSLFWIIFYNILFLFFLFRVLVMLR